MMNKMRTYAIPRFETTPGERLTLELFVAADTTPRTLRENERLTWRMRLERGGTFANGSITGELLEDAAGRVEVLFMDELRQKIQLLEKSRAPRTRATTSAPASECQVSW